MASLFSTSKTTPQVIYLPTTQTTTASQPASQTASQPASTGASQSASAAQTGSAASTGSGDLPEDTTAARIALLQRRQRGRTGTVATTWTGIMTPRSTLPQRKQLLGE